MGVVVLGVFKPMCSELQHKVTAGDESFSHSIR